MTGTVLPFTVSEYCTAMVLSLALNAAEHGSGNGVHATVIAPEGGT